MLYIILGIFLLLAYVASICFVMNDEFLVILKTTLAIFFIIALGMGGLLLIAKGMHQMIGGLS